MSVFGYITGLVNNYQLWMRYRPIIDDVEATLLKHGIDVQAMLADPAKPTADPVVFNIQQMLNTMIAMNPTLKSISPIAVDGIMGPVTLAALQAVLVKLT